MNRKERGKTNLKFYEGLHRVKMAKNSVLVAAFTVKTNHIKSSVYSLYYFESTTIEKAKKDENEAKRKELKTSNKESASKKDIVK